MLACCNITIGSITKVFTSLLLADMAQSGEVALSDPAAIYLPKGIKMPECGGRVITLEDLSRHRYGLPRLPTNFNTGSDPKNPYASYSVSADSPLIRPPSDHTEIKLDLMCKHQGGRDLRASRITQ